MSHSFLKFQSPVGELTLVANSKNLVAVLWEKEREGRVKIEDLTQDSRHPILLAARAQLKEYFAGNRADFDLPLEFYGSPFQKKVWKALTKIPYGKTSSYADLARKIGNPKASRAVGAANGRNPLSIVVPCHRVVGKNGSLTGFAGGLDIKAQLLAVEKNA